MNDVQVFQSAQEVSLATAKLWLQRIEAIQEHQLETHVSITGGRSSAAVLGAIRDSPERDAVDWRRLHIWWGDERFLPAGHPDRNETSARETLLNHVSIPEANIHPIPGPSRRAHTPELAAQQYHHALAQNLTGVALTMLGVGDDGHIASLFPDSHGLTSTSLAIAVKQSPKPPSLRVTQTVHAINNSREVWLLAWGPDKREAVHAALTETGGNPVPAAAVHGRARTVWLLDACAAPPDPDRAA